MKSPKLKCYVLMIAKHFPGTHPRGGEPTLFADKIYYGQQNHKDGAHYPDIKIHTIRYGYQLWEKRIKEVQEAKPT